MSDTIVSLKGPDRVRKRPAVVFGSDDANGAVEAVRMLIDLFATELVPGYSAGMRVTVSADGSVEIDSRDRGMILDETVEDGVPRWHRDFCEMYCGPREPDGDYVFTVLSRQNDLFGELSQPLPKYPMDSDHYFDLCCVQYASAYMHVEAVRDGVKKVLDFRKGYAVGELAKEPTDEPAGTRIRFRPDDEVFGCAQLPMTPLCEALRDLAVALPGVTCEWADERDGTGGTYHYPAGACDYIAECAAPTMPVYVAELEANGKDRYNRRAYDARVRLYVAFAKQAPDALCLHNYRTLPCGGRHLEEAKARVEWAVGCFFDGELQKAAADRLVLVIETNCTPYASDYVNATRKAIQNRMIVDMTNDLLRDDFRYYLKQNREAVLAVLQDA